MRVLHLIDSLEFGGAESALYYLAHHVAVTKSDECLMDVAVLYGRGYFGNQLEAEGVHVYDLAMRRKYDVVRLLDLVRLLRTTPYQIVHTHLFPANWFGAWVSSFVPGTVFVTTEHSVWNRRRRWPVLRLMERFVYSRYRSIIAVSEAVRQQLLQWLPEVASKTVIIPNALPLLNHDEIQARHPNNHTSLGNLPIRNHNRLVLFIGGLRYPKGVDVLIDALPVMFAKANCDVWIVGDGPLRLQLETQVEASGLRERVSFLGFREDVFDLLRVADVVVMPSRWEGLPMTLLEAMAMGRPVVASAVGGIPELIRHGETGWLVPPEDARALAETLTYVLDNADVARQVGERARGSIGENYAIEVVAQHTLDFYRDLLNER